MNMDVVPKRKFVLPHISLPKIFKNQKTRSSVQKNPQASHHVVTGDASFFRSSRSQMFYKTDVLEDFAKTQKNICAGDLF